MAQGLRLLKSFVWLALLLVLLNPSRPWAADQRAIQLSFLDVGQGDALLIHEPGSCAALIDAGPLINGHVVTRALQERQIETLDLVIITHPHLDHFGGLFDLAPRIRIKQFYDNGESSPAWEYFDDYLSLRSRLEAGILTRGDELRCGSVTFRVLYPDRVAPGSTNVNDNSLALQLSLYTTRLTHMGDLAGKGSSKLLQLDDDLGADIVKIAHHGASDAASAELLDRVSPTFAVISTAKSNRIGSPAAQTIERLAVAGAKVFRTDRDGSVSFLVDQAGLRLLEP
jgi:competence protein ComEC